MTDNMVAPSFDELFAAAESLRRVDKNQMAIEFYARIERECYPEDPAGRQRLHRMWGVALLGLGQIAAGTRKLLVALLECSNPREQAAVQRDLSRGYLLNGQLDAAEEAIDESIQAIPLDDLAERGISLGFKARILLADCKTLEALEMFGTADALLQRGSNRHYELYNLLHFLEALSEHETPFTPDEQPDVVFAETQVSRLKSLAETYGGTPHRDRAERITDKIFADREA